MPGLQVVIGYRVIDPKSGVQGMETCLPGPCMWGNNVNCHAKAAAAPCSASTLRICMQAVLRLPICGQARL